jgi:hypothetical protein
LCFVHSGSPSPATKEDQEKLTKQFEAIIDELLAEPDEPESIVWRELTGDAWRGNGGKRLLRFVLDEQGRKSFVSTMRATDRTPERHSGDPVQIRGTTVVLGQEVWRFDPRTRDLIDPRDYGRRIEKASRPGWDLNVPFDSALLASKPDLFLLTSLAYEAGRSGSPPSAPALLECTKSGFAPLRRESARALAQVKYTNWWDELEALLKDFDPLVRETAAAELKRMPRPNR